MAATIFSDKAAAREHVWDSLQEAHAAAFPFPPHGPTPNFRGAPKAARQLLSHKRMACAASNAIRTRPSDPCGRGRAAAPACKFCFPRRGCAKGFACSIPDGFHPDTFARRQRCRTLSAGAKPFQSRICRVSI